MWSWLAWKSFAWISVSDEKTFSVQQLDGDPTLGYRLVQDRYKAEILCFAFDFDHISYNDKAAGS